MTLRDRQYNLSQALQAVRSQATPALRAAQLAALRQMAQNDQLAIAQAVIAAGGRVERNFWVSSALAVELPPAALPAIQRLARVAAVWPVRARLGGDHAPAMEFQPSSDRLLAPVAPIVTSVDASNHNVQQAWGILGGSGQPPYRGAGATVAVFDSGIDSDIDGRNGTSDVHPAFVVNGAPNQSRIAAHLSVSWEPKHADCNILRTGSPYVGVTGPFGYNASTGLQDAACGHGTAMAAIVAGNHYSGQSGSYAGIGADGHAPDASIVDIACSSYDGPTARNPWHYTDVGYLGAVELLNAYIFESGSRVDVLNVSLHGESSPDHPISMALDWVARFHDILLVTCAGNFGDSTTSSNGFHNGLAVGAVHARTTDSPDNLAFVPLPMSARGPLRSVPHRFYPDLCATGGGVGDMNGASREFRYPYGTYFLASCMTMPGIDLGDPSARLPSNRVSPIRPNLGTSEAAAQVSGAATLYRGRRPQASAQEARAALLLNVVGTYASQSGATADPALQHTYTGRNTFGVGYLRDDLLAEFAVRDSAIQPLAAAVGLNVATPTNEATVYAGLTPGSRYAVVGCWMRDGGGAMDEEGPLQNIDLEIVDATTSGVVARSTTPANSYERVVFPAPSSGAVKLRVFINGAPSPNQTVLVQLAARLLRPNLDPLTTVDPVHATSGSVQVVSAGAGCTAAGHDWSVVRSVPYPTAYGSAAFAMSPDTNSLWETHNGYDNGFDLGNGRLSTMAGQPSSLFRHKLHIQYRQSEVGGAITLAGLAFRTWRPMPSSDLLLKITLEEQAWWTPTGAVPMWPLPGATAVTVVGAGGFRNIENPDSMTPPGLSAAGTGLDGFNVLVPFDAGTTFSYAGDPSKALHLWIEVQGASAPVFVVDGTNDGFSQPVESHWAAAAFPSGASPVFQYGQAPILGFVGSSPINQRELRLEAFGEPWSGLQACNLDVRITSGLPIGTLAMLFLGGWSPVPTPVTPCLSWLANPTSIGVGSLDGFGMEQFAVAVQPGLTGVEFGLQAALFPVSPGTLLTNAIRVRVGGAL